MKRIAGFVFILIVLLGLWQRDLLSYGWMQARGQLQVLWQARPIKEVLSDPDIPDSLKQKINIIRQVKKFAIDSLGLSPSDNYETIFDQKGQDILWNVSACEPYQLKPYEWHFPILGSFGYKGFFDISKAKEERDRLEVLGFDTNIRPVRAWSTLGWFSDPILSKVLGGSEGQLAELIIHELTHATIFVKDSLTFNENLASFVGQKGAERYLASTYGNTDYRYQEYVSAERDYKLFIDHMINGATVLDSVYAAIDSFPAAQKEQSKKLWIRRIVNNLDTISFYNNKRFSGLYSDTLPNNTRFMSLIRYHGVEDLLAAQYLDNFNASIQAYILHLKQKYSK